MSIGNVPMWDALRHSYRFRCPDGAAERGPVKLSAFRSVNRLDGPVHPAVFRVVHACSVCGGEHSALAPHDELDHAPLAATVEISFWNPMTGRVEGDLGHELSQAAADRLRRGQWPLSFWCSAEQRLQPGYPSSLRFVAKHDTLVGVAVTCTCGRAISPPRRQRDLRIAIQSCRNQVQQQPGPLGLGRVARSLGATGP